MSQTFELRWGIIGCGWISQSFVKDLLLDPVTNRKVTDIKHKIVAVGSRDLAKSKEWTETNIGADHGAKSYGSYEEVVADPNVTAIYVGTPHTYHYANSLLALKAGKHVLCEKPFTSNAAELKALIEVAKEKKLFLMEALWTRFQPVALEVSKLIQEKALGDIRVVQADLSGDFKVDSLPKTHRILDPRLGGGSLLDLGPYPLVWAIIALYENPDNKKKPPTKVTGTMIKTPLTGVDASAVFVLDFEDLQAHAILSTGITIPHQDPSVTIRFRNGNILLSGPPYRPTALTVQYFASPGSSTIVREVKHNFNTLGQLGDTQEGGGGGWQFQSDEVARSIRDGKIESELWGWDKSLLEMSIFDEVRKQGGYVFPEGVEQVV